MPIVASAAAALKIIGKSKCSRRQRLDLEDENCIMLRVV